MGEPVPVLNAPTLYASWGWYLESLEQFDKSIHYYDEACSHDLKNPSILTARARVLNKHALFEDAIVDANRALAISDDNIFAYYQKAAGLYGLNEFERALMMFAGGALRRKKPPYFIEGYLQALQTIQECVGVGGGNILTSFLPIIERQEKQKLRDAERLRQEKEEVQAKEWCRCAKKRKLPEVGITVQQQIEMDTALRVMSRKYLGLMADDVQFLKMLRADHRLTSANAQHSARLRTLATKGYDMLADENFSILRTRRPYYAVKHMEQTLRPSSTFSDNRKTLQKVNTLTAVRLIERCEAAMRAKNAALCFEFIDRARNFIFGKTLTQLPPKRAYLTRVYNIVGEIILAQKRLNMEMSDEDNETRVNFLFGAPISRRGSRDSVLKYFPSSAKTVATQIRQLERLLDESTILQEKMYCYHELSWLHCEQKEHAKSMLYAMRLLSFARAHDDATWEINGILLLTRNHALQHNRNDMKLSLIDAQEASKKLKRGDILRNFLETALKIVEESDDMVDDSEALREKAIINVMIDNKLKEKTRILFRKMSIMPTARRFTIVPGGKARPSEAPAMAAGRRMTILNLPNETRKKSPQGIRPLGVPDLETFF